MQSCTQLQPVLVTLTAASNDVATSSDGVVSLVADRLLLRLRTENDADRQLFPQSQFSSKNTLTRN